ncbi:KOW motif-containing protein, partial [Methylobacterium planeticum]
LGGPFGRRSPRKRGPYSTPNHTQEREDAAATSYRQFLAKQAEASAEAARERKARGLGYEVGEVVRVAKGPFASFNGTVVGIDDERQRMLAEVSLFGRATPIELGFADVQKAA